MRNAQRTRRGASRYCGRFIKPLKQVDQIVTKLITISAQSASTFFLQSFARRHTSHRIRKGFVHHGGLPSPPISRTPLCETVFGNQAPAKVRPIKEAGAPTEETLAAAVVHAGGPGTMIRRTSPRIAGRGEAGLPGQGAENEEKLPVCRASVRSSTIPV
jgi:hypothetical protein